MFICFDLFPVQFRLLVHQKVPQDLRGRYIRPVIKYYQLFIQLRPYGNSQLGSIRWPFQSSKVNILTSKRILIIFQLGSYGNTQHCPFHRSLWVSKVIDINVSLTILTYPWNESLVWSQLPVLVPYQLRSPQDFQALSPPQVPLGLRGIIIND